MHIAAAAAYSHLVKLGIMWRSINDISLWLDPQPALRTGLRMRRCGLHVRRCWLRLNLACWRTRVEPASVT